MKTLHVKTGRPYDILIENGILKDCGAHIRKCSRAGRAMIISDSNVFPLYGNAVSDSLSSNGRQQLPEDPASERGTMHPRPPRRPAPY